MAKRKIRKHEGGIPANADLQYALQEGQTEDGYRRALEDTYALFVKAERDWRDMNISRLGAIWTIGDEWINFFLGRASNKGSVSDTELMKVAQDLDHFPDGSRINKEILRYALNLRQTYTKTTIEKLAARGASETHVASFMQIEDDTFRKQIENTSLSDNLSGAETRKLVRALAKDPVKQKYLKPTSRARYKQEATKKKKSVTDNPQKQIARSIAQIDSSAEVFADLLISLDHVSKLKSHERQVLAEPLGELLGKLRLSVQSFTEIQDRVFDAVFMCGQANMSGPAPSGTAERAVEARTVKSRSKKTRSKKAGSKRK